MTKSKDRKAFDEAMKSLVQVPKKELDAMERHYQAAKAKRKKGKPKK